MGQKSEKIQVQKKQKIQAQKTVENTEKMQDRKGTNYSINRVLNQTKFISNQQQIKQKKKNNT